MANYEKVEEVIGKARGIAFDTCHKIYVLMDEEQMALMRTYEYDPLISADEMSPAEMLETIKGWYEESCGLRFISAVATHPTDPNLGFTNLIAQGEGDEDCEDCGESGCAGVCNDYEDEDEDEDE
jgi:hypothetical protein